MSGPGLCSALTTDFWTECSTKSWRFCFPKTKLKVTLEVCVVLCLVLLGQVTMIAGVDVEKRESGSNVTVAAANLSSSQNTTKMDEPSSKSNAGTVAVVTIICVLALITVIVSVYFFRRKRHTRMMDKEKKMQIQMSSARNAGVYQDLTVTVPADDRTPASPEHERLKPAEDA